MTENTIKKVPFPVGLRVKEIRIMTDEEMEAEGWDHYGSLSAPEIIIFEDGSKLYPSCDPEGNGPGCLFGMGPDGTPVYVTNNI